MIDWLIDWLDILFNLRRPSFVDKKILQGPTPQHDPCVSLSAFMPTNTLLKILCGFLLLLFYENCSDISHSVCQQRF